MTINQTYYYYLDGVMYKVRLHTTTKFAKRTNSKGIVTQRETEYTFVVLDNHLGLNEITEVEVTEKQLQNTIFPSLEEAKQFWIEKHQERIEIIESINF